MPKATKRKEPKGFCRRNMDDSGDCLVAQASNELNNRMERTNLSNQRSLISYLKISSHVDVEKAQKIRGFMLEALTKQAQAVTSRNDSLAIRLCTFLIQGLILKI
ncbi:hypothetical protein Tco_1186528 [Tanacetum coccineum]